MSLEKDLKRAMARKEAPAGFADRVLDRIDTHAAPWRTRRRLTNRLSRVAALLLVGTIGTGAWLQHQENGRQRREAEQASILVRIALQIASEKTNIAREHLTGVDPDKRKSRKEGNTDETTND